MERDNFFDSLKFILIFLVVLGHVIEVLIIDGGGNRTLLRAFYGLIYSFHMPLFIFISGYFSKNVNLNKLGKSTISLLIPYFIFQFILLIPHLLKGSFDITTFLTEPQKGLWYIVSLICWRMVAAGLNVGKKLSFALILPLSLLLALAIGFTPLSISTFSLSRTIVFLPYFLLGFYCKPEIIEKIRGVKKIYPLAVFICLSLFIIKLSGMRPAFIHSFWGIVPYDEYGSLYAGLIYRVFVYGITFAMSILVISISGTIFAKYGNKTLEIYLLHLPIVYLLLQLLLIKYPSNIDLIEGILIAVAITVFCLLLAKLKPIQYLVNPMRLIKK